MFNARKRVGALLYSLRDTPVHLKRFTSSTELRLRTDGVPVLDSREIHFLICRNIALRREGVLKSVPAV